MPKFTPLRQEQIMRQMLATILARTDLSDISDASRLKRILKAAARQDAEQYFQMVNLLDLFSIERCTGDDLKDRAFEFAKMEKLPAAKAVGTLVFSRVGTVGTTTVPIGTRAKTASGVTFVTTSAGSITNGNSVSTPIPCLAAIAGSAGNVAASTIIKFDNKPAGITGVINTNPTTGGADEESDDAFKVRIRLYVASLARSTEQAIEAGVIGIIDPVSGKQVRSVNVQTDAFDRGRFYVYIDDGTGAAETTAVVTAENLTEGLGPGDDAVGGEVFLKTNFYPIKPGTPLTVTSDVRGALVENTHFKLDRTRGQFKFTPALVLDEEIDVTYTKYTGLLAYVQKVVYGDKTDRTHFPGFAAAGTHAFVTSPQVLIQSIDAVLTIKEGFDELSVRAAVKDAVVAYINNLQISDDLIRASLIKIIMLVAGVGNVQLNTPATDIITLDDQLQRTSSGSVTLT